MIEIVEIVAGVMLIIFGIMAVSSKKIINSVIFLSILSMLAVLSFIFMRAPDVAITEAVIGSGLVTAIFIFTLLSVKKAGGN